MKKTPKQPILEPIVIPTWQVAMTFLTAFVTPLVFYVLALAPTVTFEDSGELITAAHTLGVPHEPGYPLFTMLGKLFSLIPFGDVAYRVNLLSAVFSAMAVGFLALLILDLGACLFGNPAPVFRWVISGMAVCAAMIVAMGRSYMSQAVITEVYALNDFLTALLLWLLVRWYIDSTSGREPGPARERYFYLYCFFAGLTLTNHHTSAIFLPMGIATAFLIDRTYLLDRLRLLAGGACVIAGLLPYVYLPVASWRNPAMDWGDPENWTNFWRVVGRHQYGLDVGTTRSMKVLLSQIGLHYEMLFEQFTVWFIAAGLLGLVVLWSRRRPLFYLALLFNVLTGPLVAYVTNVNITGRDPFAIAEQKGLVSVMYLPFYLFWGILVGIGFLWMAEWAMRKGSWRPAWVAILLMAVAGAGYMTWNGFRHEDMSRYHFTEQFLDDLERHIEPDAIVFANWDPFAFPVMYHQHVAGRAKDVIFVDVELLRRTWYITMLKSWYPAFMNACRAEVDAFLAAVRPFEDKEPFDPNFIQQRYVAMIQAMADRHFDTRPIYVTIFQPIRPLEQGLLANYALESRLVAQRLRRAPFEPEPMDDRTLDFGALTDPETPKDRMANMLRNYYAIRFADRAMMMEGRDRDQAIRLYQRAMDVGESAMIRGNIQKRLEINQGARKP